MGASKGGTPRIRYYGRPHPILESMATNPPEGFSYVSNLNQAVYTGYTGPPVYQQSSRIMARAANTFFKLVRAPRTIPMMTDCDLVHMDGCVLPLTSKPWVVGSIEYAGAFFAFDDAWYERRASRRMLARALGGPRCKKVMTLSEAALESLSLSLGEEFAPIKGKTSVLYPAVPTERVEAGRASKKEDGTIRILFVGNHFFDKGGRELFFAYQRLRRRYDLELMLVTSAPPHHREYFEAFKKKLTSEPGVSVHTAVPKEALLKDFFLKSHIFCFPSYMETFGYVVLEAMASNLAVVTSDEYALPEMIRNGENGLLVHAPYASFRRGALRSPSSLEEYRRAVLEEKNFSSVVDELETSLSKLIEDGTLRRRLASAALQETTEGRFSVLQRNKQLAEIYREALG